MNEEGQCKECGAFYDRNTYPICPRCRAASVAKAYMPRDPERTLTAMGLEYSRYASGEELKQAAETGMWYRPVKQDKEETPDQFPGLPLGEAAQVYELRRMFRTLHDLRREV